jgi:hypothetical protein
MGFLFSRVLESELSFRLKIKKSPIKGGAFCGVELRGEMSNFLEEFESLAI